MNNKRCLTQEEIELIYAMWTQLQQLDRKMVGYEQKLGDIQVDIDNLYRRSESFPVRNWNDNFDDT